MDQNTDEQKIRTSTIICCGQQYIIKHKNKNITKNDDTINYFSLAIFFFKKYKIKITKFINDLNDFVIKNHFDDEITFLWIVHIFCILFTIVLNMISIIDSLTKYHNETRICAENTIACEIFAKNCLTDKIVTMYEGSIRRVNSDTALSCVRQHTSYWDYFYKTQIDLLGLVYYAYYYVIMIFICYIIIKLLFITILNLLEKTKEKVNKIVLEVEEV